MTSYIIPLIFLTVVVMASFKKQNAYRTFISGTKDAIPLVVEVFPFLLAVMTAVELFQASGVSTAVSNFLAPVMSLVGIPSELTELILIRPLSGAGSLAVLDGIFSSYGVDTYIGACASLIYGSSETAFYVSAVYFSGSSVKNLRFALPVALFSSFAGCVVGCFLLRFV